MGLYLRAHMQLDKHAGCNPVDFGLSGFDSLLRPPVNRGVIE